MYTSTLKHSNIHSTHQYSCWNTRTTIVSVIQCNIGPFHLTLMKHWRALGNCRTSGISKGSWRVYCFTANSALMFSSSFTEHTRHKLKNYVLLSKKLTYLILQPSRKCGRHIEYLNGKQGKTCEYQTSLGGAKGVE